MDNIKDYINCYKFDTPKKRYILKKSPVTLTAGGKEYLGKGNAILDLRKKPEIYFDAKITKATFGFLPDNLSFTIGENEIKGFFTNSSTSWETDICKLRWKPKSGGVTITGDDETKIKTAFFHLFNFLDVSFRGESLELHYADWIVELFRLPDTAKNIKSIEEEGGYKLTHIGRIEKQDEEGFTGKELNDFLVGINYFFSFVKGAWSETVCSIGLSEENDIVWEFVSSTRATDGHLNLFASKRGDLLQSLFSGFMEKWMDEETNKILHTTLSIYLNANMSGLFVESKVALAQAALERLHAGLFPDSEETRASGRIRELLLECEIPADIDSKIPNLANFKTVNGLDDFPHALTKIRNSIIHPEFPYEMEMKGALFDAWKLGMWYLDLRILKFCDYNLYYGNRLKQDRLANQLEPVPWHKDSKCKQE